MTSQELVPLSEAIREVPTDGGPDGVAAFLLSKGILGERGNGADCPLARYLRMRTGIGPDELLVDGALVHHRWTDPDGQGWGSEILLLHHTVTKFVTNFDQFNAYPELLAA